MYQPVLELNFPRDKIEMPPSPIEKWWQRTVDPWWTDKIDPWFDEKIGPVLNAAQKLFDKNSLNLKPFQLFGIEKAMYSVKFDKYIKDNPYQPILICTIYLLGCYLGVYWMRKKAPLDLKRLRAVWNAVFVVFSTFGSFRLGPIILEIYRIAGIKGLVYHDAALTYKHHGLALWTHLFIISKTVELLDTFFIILRKEPLSYIHRYHHATVLVYAWWSYARGGGVAPALLALHLAVDAPAYAHALLGDALALALARAAAAAPAPAAAPAGLSPIKAIIGSSRAVVGEGAGNGTETGGGGGALLPGWVLPLMQVLQMFLGVSLCLASAVFQYSHWVMLLKALDLINLLKQFRLLTPARLPATLEWLERLRILPPLELAHLGMNLYLIVSYIALWMMLWEKGCYLVEGYFFAADEKVLKEVHIDPAVMEANGERLAVLTVATNNSLHGISMVFAYTPTPKPQGKGRWGGTPHSVRCLNLAQPSLRRNASTPSLRRATQSFLYAKTVLLSSQKQRNAASRSYSSLMPSPLQLLRTARARSGSYFSRWSALGTADEAEEEFIIHQARSDNNNDIDFRAPRSRMGSPGLSEDFDNDNPPYTTVRLKNDLSQLHYSPSSVDVDENEESTTSTGNTAFRGRPPCRPQHKRSSTDSVLLLEERQSPMNGERRTVIWEKKMTGHTTSIRRSRGPSSASTCYSSDRQPITIDDEEDDHYLKT